MRYVSLALLVALCLFAGCPSVPLDPDGSKSDGAVQDTVVADASTDTVTKDETKPDPGAPDTPTKDDPVTPDLTTPDPGKPDVRDEPVVDSGPDATTPDATPDAVTDSVTDAISDSVTDAMTDSVTDTMTDAIADTTPDVVTDTTPDVVTDATPDVTPDVIPDVKGLTCVEREQKSSAQVDNVRQQHLSCTTNMDCTGVSMSTGCRGACLSPVNVTGKPLVEAEIKNVNQTYCKDYQADNCPYATPRCVNSKILCDQKVCKNFDCTSRRSTASARMKAVIDRNTKCVTDNDCVLVFNSTSCAGACQVAVNKTGEGLLKAEIADINLTVCADYRTDGCPYATPSCAAAKAACSSGICTSVNATP